MLLKSAVQEAFMCRNIRTRRLLASLETNAAPRDRDVEAIKARQRAKARFG